MQIDFSKMFNKEAAAQQAREISEKQSRRGGPDFFKMNKNGRAVIRVMPPGNILADPVPPGVLALMQKGSMGRVVYKHYIKLDGQNVGIFTSGILTDPQTYSYCPIAEALDKVSGVVPKDVLSDLKASARCLFNVVLRYHWDHENREVDKDTWGSLQIFEGPAGFYEWVVQTSNDPLNGLFIDPFQGIDSVITRTGTGGKQGTDYSYGLRGNVLANPACDTVEATEAMIRQLPDLSERSKISEKEMGEQKQAATRILAWARKYGYKGDETTAGGVGGGAINLSTLFNNVPEKREGGPTVPATPPSPPQTAVPVAAAPQPGAINIQVQPKPTATGITVQPMALSVATPSVQPTTQTAPVTVGGVQKPALGPNGQPVCYGQYVARNGSNDPNAVKDAQCGICDVRLACSFGPM